MPPNDGEARHDSLAPDASRGEPSVLKRLLFLLPVVVFAVVAAYFLWGLNPERDPREVPSALIDKPVPEFELPPIPGGDKPGFSSADLTGSGQVALVNVFASWCIPCKAEHPLLMRLAADDVVPVYGINYKDKPAEARQWLADLGNPYTKIGADLDGRVAIEWGVYGVPETFVIGPEGRIRYKHTGPMRPEDLEEKILPLVENLRGG